MARGEGRPDGVPGGGGGSRIMASITGLGGGAGGGAEAAATVKHRALEEAFVVEGGRVVNLEGFVQEDFGVVFDEVFCILYVSCGKKGWGCLLLAKGRRFTVDLYRRSLP